MSNKMKRVLTFEDLIALFETQKFSKFNSKDTGYQLSVKVPTTFEIDNNVDDNHRGMMKLKIRIFHTGINRNGSKVSKESAEKAMSTIPDRPILAAIHQLDSGEWDFEGHEMEIVKNDDGTESIRYIESQVGSFSSEPAFWEHDDELDKDYVCAYAYISEEYTRCADIIRRKNGTKNSCELFIDELAYDSREKCLDLIDFYINASTLLGSRDDGTEIAEGMLGSRADIADFSVKNNSVKFNQDEKLIEILDKLNTTLSKFNIDDNTTKGGKIVEKENFVEEVAETEEVTETEETTEEEVTATESESETANEETPKESETPVEESETVEETTNDTEVDNKYSMSVKCGDKCFEISLQEKIFALSELVNSTYAESDNTYYGVEVYDGHLVMMDYWNGRYFKQSYKEEDEVFSLVGDRVEVFAEFVTAEEQDSLKEMRSNYASLIEFKATAEKNELNSQREAILTDEKYSVLATKDEEGNFTNTSYAELYKNMENYSLEDLEKEIKIILGEYALNGGKFSAVEEPKPEKSGVKKFVNVNKNAKKNNKYGNLKFH